MTAQVSYITGITLKEAIAMYNVILLMMISFILGWTSSIYLKRYWVQKGHRLAHNILFKNELLQMQKDKQVTSKNN